MDANLKDQIAKGSEVITGCDKSAERVAVPASIAGCPVTEIGYAAFKDCGSLTRAVLPDSVTDLREAGAWGAWESCWLLGKKKVDTP